MTTKMRIISMSVEPEFAGVASTVEEIAKKYNTSNSFIYRTILHNFVGVPTSNPESHEFFMRAIEMELSKMQNQQVVEQEVKC